jgi:hypothetical protein
VAQEIRLPIGYRVVTALFVESRQAICFKGTVAQEIRLPIGYSHGYSSLFVKSKEFALKGEWPRK